MDPETRKQLENFFSWSEFYSKNHQWEQYEKIEGQIEAFKFKNNLN